MATHSIGIGDNVMVVGRFINHEGKQRNLPTARFGNVAQMPWEPVVVGSGLTRREQESFLVEARSISGYSGSPVLVDATAFDRPKRRDTLLLLGVQWGYINDWDPVCDAAGNNIPQDYKVRTNTGMMAVVPAWKLLEMLELPQMRQGRVEAEERFLANRDLPTATMTHAEQEQTEIAQRQDNALTRALTAPLKRQHNSGAKEPSGD